MIKPILTLLLTVIVSACNAPKVDSPDDKPSPQLHLPKTSFMIANQLIQVQVADTERTREKGLMYQEFLAKNDGMLFSYENQEIRCFWMKNTPLPLSIAFLDSNWHIVDIQSMSPLSEEIHCSKYPAQYALEMNQDWFANNAIKVGDTLQRK